MITVPVGRFQNSVSHSAFSSFSRKDTVAACHISIWAVIQMDVVSKEDAADFLKLTKHHTKSVVFPQKCRK